jgi:hypothetical protein
VGWQNVTKPHSAELVANVLLQVLLPLALLAAPHTAVHEPRAHEHHWRLASIIALCFFVSGRWCKRLLRRWAQLISCALWHKLACCAASSCCREVAVFSASLPCWKSDSLQGSTRTALP